MQIKIIGYPNCIHYIRARDKILTNWSVDPILVTQHGLISTAVDTVLLNHVVLLGARATTSPQIILMNNKYACCIGGEDQLNTIGCKSLADYFEAKVAGVSAHYAQYVFRS
jgi:hypothetical protein